MAFPTDSFTGAGGDLDKFIQEVWGNFIRDFAKEARHITRFFTDRSYELSDGGDTIHNPGMTEMTANAKVNAASVTLNSPTETTIDIVVNDWQEVSFAIEDREVAIYKKSYYLQERYAKNAAYTVAMKLEDKIIDKFASFSSSIGTNSTAITDALIREALGIVETAVLGEEVDSGNVAFFFDRKVFWNQIAGIDVYQKMVNNGTANPLMKKPVRFLYSIPVYTSSRIPYDTGTTGRKNVLAHKDSIHYALAPLPGQGDGLVRTQSNYIPEFLSTVTTADIFMGCEILRPTYGCLLISQEE